MEVAKLKDSKTEREVWYVFQASYIKDLISKAGEEVKKKKVPITRDQSAQLGEKDEKVEVEDVRQSQKQVGELLWIVTRTRPDLMYAVSRMGSLVTKSPTKVNEIYQQVIGYLLRTSNEGLSFKSSPGDAPVLEVFTDASFAPDGRESHGSFVVEFLVCPIFWRSGKQSFVTLSTAEAEMMEVIEGMVAGESVLVMASEIFKGVARKVWTDSQSAQATLCLESGSWRTRHLRIRATAARQAFQRAEWLLQQKMIADIGTKPLAAARFNMLKEELGMKEWKEKIEEDAEQKKEEKKEGGDEKSSVGFVKQVAKIIMIAALLDGVKAQEDEEEEPGTTEFQVMMVAFALLIVFATLAIQWLLGFFSTKLRYQGDLRYQETRWRKNQKKKKEAESPKMERPKSLPEPASVGRAASSNETVAGLPTGGDAPWVGGEPAATLPPEAASGDALWVVEENPQLRSRPWPQRYPAVMRRGLEENPRLRSRP